MYDDEYGNKDPMEDDMKDKSAIKFDDLMGKDHWIGSKFKMLAKSIKDRRNRIKERKKYRNFKNVRNKTNTNVKRSVPVPKKKNSGKRVFEELTANMKRVCNEAAQAIRETTNREVRADNSEQASSLMQQVVGLMTELVDLQVREKTCIHLPEDLRSFLVWLTSPSSEEYNDAGFPVNNDDPVPMLNLRNLDDNLSSDARSECLGTIHDVEDLIMQYDEMSEEDKSKMSGVREYLEHQLHYLHMQLSNFNEYGSTVMYQEQIRKRRQPKRLNRQRKRNSHKFLKYYGKKHTKYTIFDEVTDDYRSIKGKKKRNEEREEARNEGNRLFENIETKDDKVNENRNLGRNVESDMKSFNDYLSSLVKDNGSFVKYNKV
ncbi:uncharacterized protein LOC134802962 [Cydia splendana]|uniref:uncharacterized protein LOC134802962 n=1 Tax=Cydia splendana TaxID=1100963 RepID=UPI0028F4BF8E